MPGSGEKYLNEYYCKSASSCHKNLYYFYYDYFSYDFYYRRCYFITVISYRYPKAHLLSPSCKTGIRNHALSRVRIEHSVLSIRNHVNTAFADCIAARSLTLPHNGAARIDRVGVLEGGSVKGPLLSAPLWAPRRGLGQPASRVSAPPPGAALPAWAWGGAGVPEGCGQTGLARSSLLSVPTPLRFLAAFLH